LQIGLPNVATVPHNKGKDCMIEKRLGMGSKLTDYSPETAAPKTHSGENYKRDFANQLPPVL
jgi:hypothetical protein